MSEQPQKSKLSSFFVFMGVVGIFGLIVCTGYFIWGNTPDERTSAEEFTTTEQTFIIDHAISEHYQELFTIDDATVESFEVNTDLSSIDPASLRDQLSESLDEHNYDTVQLNLDIIPDEELLKVVEQGEHTFNHYASSLQYFELSADGYPAQRYAMPYDSRIWPDDNIPGDGQALTIQHDQASQTLETGMSPHMRFTVQEGLDKYQRQYALDMGMDQEYDIAARYVETTTKHCFSHAPAFSEEHVVQDGIFSVRYETIAPESLPPTSFCLEPVVVHSSSSPES